MEKKIRIEPTTLPLENLNEDLVEYIALSLGEGATGIHFDVVDGKYAPNKSMSIKKAVTARKAFPYANFTMHLMTTSPAKYLKTYLKAKPQTMFFQVEGCKNLTEAKTLLSKKYKNAAVGIAIGRQSDLTDELLEVVKLCPAVLLLAVNAGKCGEEMGEDTIEKIKQIKLNAPNTLVFVDGGLNGTNYVDVVKAGADVLAFGSYFYKIIKTAEGDDFIAAVKNCYNKLNEPTPDKKAPAAKATAKKATTAKKPATKKSTNAKKPAGAMKKTSDAGATKKTSDATATKKTSSKKASK